MDQFEEQNSYTFEESASAAPQEPAAAPKPEKKKSGRGWLIAVVIVLALAAGIGGSMLRDAIKDLNAKAETTMSEQQLTPAEAEESPVTLEENKLPEKLKTNKGNKTLTAAEVYENNVNAVVGIRTEAITTNIWGQRTEASSAGTGFILSEDGYIVTNNHVISGANTVTVALYNGEEYEAKIIAGDDVNDVALLKIEATGLQTVSVGKSEDLIVGEEVVAIGNPLGELTFTMTHGYISALDRAINTSGTPINMLQTDAAINAGNSGGPLFDMNGNVIAMNTAKPSSSTANGTTVEGIGFAIPIDDVISIVYDLQQNGKVTGRAYLGITMRNMDATTAETYKLPIGVYVYAIEENSAAKASGMQEGDIILEFNGEKVESSTDLRAEMNRLKAGQTVDVKVYRGGQEITLSVTLGEQPEEDSAQTQQEQEQQNSGGYYTIDPSQLFPGFSFGF